MTTTAPIHDICPKWCTDSHDQAVADGCEEELVAIHFSEDVGGETREIRNTRADRVIRPQGGDWRLCAHQDAHEYEFPIMPTIELELSGWGEQLSYARLHLTSGEARTMARQLEHLADLIDL